MTSDWPTRIGWALFIGLLIDAFFNGNTAVNPFAVGLFYYVMYVMIQSFKEESGEVVIDPATRKHRLFSVCLIALSYLGFNVFGNLEKSELLRDVENICASAEYEGSLSTQRVCEPLMYYLDPPDEDDY
jgi:hypothetical protein